MLGLAGTHIFGTSKVPAVSGAVLDMFGELPGRAVLQRIILRKLFPTQLLRWMLSPTGKSSRRYQIVVAESSLEGS